MGELTKLCAYVSQLLFQVTLQPRGRSRRGSGSSHTLSGFRIYEILWDLYSDILIGCMIWLLDMVYVVSWFDQTMFLIINVSKVML